jgi:hypothetical protein
MLLYLNSENTIISELCTKRLCDTKFMTSAGCQCASWTYKLAREVVVAVGYGSVLVSLQ